MNKWLVSKIYLNFFYDITGYIGVHVSSESLRRTSVILCLSDDSPMTRYIVVMPLK